jgi:2-alkyl-3-oxoalkanoate reductase
MNRVLVSGASGFLGSAVATRLLSSGIAVRALVRSRQKGELLEQMGAEIVCGDIRDRTLRVGIDDVDTVIHCAAAIGPVAISPEERHAINVDGTSNLITLFRRAASLRRFVHVSSVAVVGDTDPKNPADEQIACRPRDSYAQTKLLAEEVVRDAVTSGFPAVIVRPMWIYGSLSTLTANLFAKIARRKLPMVGAARNTVQPIFVTDAVDALLRCTETSGIEGKIYNIAGPETLTIRCMCETIAKAVGTTLPKLRIPISSAILVAAISESILPHIRISPPVSFQKLEFFRLNNSYSIERAKRELNWVPKIPFAQGARLVAEELKATLVLGA